jgi:hypothetical protein
MSPTITEIAEAFSRHEFDRTFPHMDDDIEWAQIGEGHVQGKADVVTACEKSSEYLQAFERHSADSRSWRRRTAS